MSACSTLKRINISFDSIFWRNRLKTKRKTYNKSEIRSKVQSTCTWTHNMNCCQILQSWWTSRKRLFPETLHRCRDAHDGSHQHWTNFLIYLTCMWEIALYHYINHECAALMEYENSNRNVNLETQSRTHLAHINHVRFDYTYSQIGN